MDSASLLRVIKKRRSVRVYKAGKVSDKQLAVILEAARSDKRSPSDLDQIYVRSTTTGELVPLANLVKVRPFADSSTRNRNDRLRAITISAALTISLSATGSRNSPSLLVMPHRRAM